MAAARALAGPDRRGLTALAALLAILSVARPAVPSPLGEHVGVAAFEGVRAAADSGGPALAAAVPVLSGAPGTGFTLRRVPNPRYRPPSGALPGFGPGATGTLRSIDRAHAQWIQRGTGVSRTREWDASLGKEYRQGNSIGLSGSGIQTTRRSDLRSLRLDAKRDRLAGGLGDLPAAAIGNLASLQRLRGGALRYEPAEGTQARFMAGVPTPVPGQPTRRIAVAGAALDGLRFDEGALSIGVVAFRRGAVRARAPYPADADSLAGSGATGSFGVHAPLPLGALGMTVAGGWHDLDGHGGLAAQQALEWSWANPRATLAFHDARATSRARVIGTETLAPAPLEEDRWNAQLRGARGRVEAHFTGAVRAGGDSSLAARTLQLGASGSLPHSPWYSGIEFTNDRRPASGLTERRLSFHAGEVSAGGRALLFRLERSTNDAGRDALLLANETSLALRRGARLSLEPRAGWSDRKFDQGALAARFQWPLAWMSARLTGAATVGVSRDGAFRPGLRDAEISMTFAPRPRDLGATETRRIHEGGPAVWEYGASYDLQSSRYENAGGWLSRRDSSRVRVQVVRSGNHSGVEEVLVSLDGKDLRFTDADGVAWFDHVTPGIHVVAVEERSLPVNYQVVSMSRVFVTLERGRLPDNVTFEIARPTRKTVFP